MDYYDYGGKEKHRIKDGSKTITPVIISEKNQTAFNSAVAKGDATIESLKGLGITYDTKSISKLYSDNIGKNAANQIGGDPVTEGAKIKIDGKSVSRNSLQAEVVANTVLEDGVVSIGKNPVKTALDAAGAPQDAGEEPNRVGSAHIHTFDKETIVDVNNGAFPGGSYHVHGGHPSGIPGEGNGDYQEHTRAFQTGGAKNGVRSIMVDSKNIYLYNSSPNQTIVIPRPR